MVVPNDGAFRTQPDCLIVVGQDSFRGPLATALEMLRDDTVPAGICIVPTESDRLNAIGDGGVESFLFWYASLRLV